VTMRVMTILYAVLITAGLAYFLVLVVLAR
jgi:hypothetical protein